MYSLEHIYQRKKKDIKMISTNTKECSKCYFVIKGKDEIAKNCNYILNLVSIPYSRFTSELIDLPRSFLWSFYV